MTEERRRSLWLALAAGQNPRRHRILLEDYGSAGAVYAAAAGGRLEHRHPGDETHYGEIMASANEDFIERSLEELERKGIAPVLYEDAEYPALLREIYLPPPILFIKGRLPRAIPLPIAVIGSRKCSRYGREVAESIGGELARCGACVVSGMAYGVDEIAARAALKEENAFPTIAVLGCGADVIYPSYNSYLYSQICERGAVISEFPPGTPPNAQNFPRRNRIISGISKGVVVIEAAKRSGTSITVDFALEQGRDVFAVPGRINDPACEGTNYLIREGMAKPVFGTADILEEYGIDAGAGRRAAQVDEAALSREEQAVFSLLRGGRRSVDELCELTGMEPGRLNSVLTEMEISGIIKQSPGRMYGL